MYQMQKSFLVILTISHNADEPHCPSDEPHCTVQGRHRIRAQEGPGEPRGTRGPQGSLGRPSGPRGTHGEPRATSQILEKDGSLKIVIFVLTLYLKVIDFEAILQGVYKGSR